MKKKLNVKTMTFIALCTAIICILGPLSITIPISPVPITPSLFAIFLAAYVLNKYWATVSVLLYLLIGMVGVPVFSKFTSGPAKLFGPTGGYLIGYIPLIFITALFIEKNGKKIYMHVLGMIIGLVILYTLGTAWLAITAHMDFKAALFAGVIPFIPADIIKMVLAILVGVPLRKAISRIN